MASPLYGLLFLACWRALRLRPGVPIARWSLTLIGITGAFAVAQLVHPELEHSLQRSAVAIDGGEIWRLATSFLVQGGGVFGVAFNLITLAVTAILAARAFSPVVGLVIYVLGGVGGNLLSLAFDFPDDAGSSLATMTLAMAAACATVPLDSLVGRVCVGALAVVAVGLLVLRDQHAIAAVLGAGSGVVLRRGVPDRIAAGATCWVGAVTFFIGQAVAEAGVSNHYSAVRNMVSDLGMVTCEPADVGAYHTDVCSPWHLAMNLGFAATGCALLAGTILLRPLLPPGRPAEVGAALLVAGGLGKIGAGLTPGDLYPIAHMAVAVFSGPAPTIGILIVGWSLRSSRPTFARITLICGATGVLGFALTAPATSAGWAGLAERIAMYPMVLWIIGTGVAILFEHQRTSRSTEPREADTNRPQ
ncbi:rhomboid family intramembrane serine protease [Tsukamurella sp. 1534]|uniref:rhomboid family intramembrane serine protease n=1 Tax=Tsukamurella sp. 1534 TaxID=1151061 RepID=UPI000592E253|nr:rhomboid family intramembrane serine protease [Tsukamurella sp. 1534]